MERNSHGGAIEVLGLSVGGVGKVEKERWGDKSTKGVNAVIVLSAAPHHSVSAWKKHTPL